MSKENYAPEFGKMLNNASHLVRLQSEISKCGANGPVLVIYVTESVAVFLV
jgi:hypothetical protein